MRIPSYRHFELHILHSGDDCVKAVGEVVEDELTIRLDLLRREGDAVDEPHLLQDGGLARVSGAEEQDLEGGDRLRDWGAWGEIGSEEKRTLTCFCSLSFACMRSWDG